MKKAIVLLSGGLDSATVLAIAKSQNFECHSLNINYGQKHSIECEKAKEISILLKAKTHKIINLNLHDLGGSSLLDNSIPVPKFNENQKNSIPNTYVPARNTTFLSIALGYAECIEAYDIFIGACEVDYSNYPDCREKFIIAFEKLANVATKAAALGKNFSIHAPLLKLTKAEIIKYGTKLGVDYSKTISCYNANNNALSCGACDSCTYRKKGFKEAKITDPTKYLF